MADDDLVVREWLPLPGAFLEPWHVREHNAVARAYLASEPAREIGAEIMEIMATYREQQASRHGVDTPGGLEHMGDVWKLLAEWDERLRAAEPDKGKFTETEKWARLQSGEDAS